MISRQFVAPNFVVDASEEDGKRRKWVTYASSEGALLERLEEEEWTVHSVQAYDFDEWRRRSSELLEQVEHALQDDAKPDFDGAHYGKLKHHLFELFEGKCAYCEGEGGHVESGQVEHYRPKRGVYDDPEHPGYYWLAYDVGNLLPACERCNTAGAKMNHFPVQSGTRASTPEAVARERPLLLNPYFDTQPLDHLKFLKTGRVVGRTDRGERSIDIYRLKRREVKRRRGEAVQAMEKKLDTETASKGWERAASDMIEELSKGRREYSAALLSVIPEWLDRRDDAAARLREKLLPYVPS
jgi:hypothetical protein